MADNLIKLEGVGKEEIIYNRRFSSAEEETRAMTWEVLCREFFQPLIPKSSRVLDLGAGDGNFITNINAARRVAVDLSEHARALSEQGVEVHITSATDFANKIGEKVDVIFMSNFLEHLPTKQILLEVLDECRSALRPNGRLMILQPNIRYVGGAYWDYIDHHIALTEYSLVEALDISGFSVEKLIPRFLPYTAKSKLGSLAKSREVISWYLKLPILWRIFGQQTFVVARVDN